MLARASSAALTLSHVQTPAQSAGRQRPLCAPQHPQGRGPKDGSVTARCNARPNTHRAEAPTTGASPRVAYTLDHPQGRRTKRHERHRALERTLGHPERRATNDGCVAARCSARPNTHWAEAPTTGASPRVAYTLDHPQGRRTKRQERHRALERTLGHPERGATNNGGVPVRRSARSATQSAETPTMGASPCAAAGPSTRTTPAPHWWARALWRSGGGEAQTRARLMFAQASQVSSGMRPQAISLAKT